MKESVNWKIEITQTEQQRENSEMKKWNHQHIAGGNEEWFGIYI